MIKYKIQRRWNFRPTHFPEEEKICDETPYLILFNYAGRIQIQIMRRYDLRKTWARYEHKQISNESIYWQKKQIDTITPSEFGTLTGDHKDD